LIVGLSGASRVRGVLLIDLSPGQEIQQFIPSSVMRWSAKVLLNGNRKYFHAETHFFDKKGADFRALKQQLKSFCQL
jgi:hypothetical protein